MKHKLKAPKTLIIALTLSTVLGIGAWPLKGTPEVTQRRPPHRETIDRQRIVFVDPNRGSDRQGSGRSQQQAFRTITYALQRANNGTVIKLAPGRYASEEFPLKLPDGVILQGNQRRQGAGFEIVGGGFHINNSSNGSWASQNVTIVPGENSQILGVTVTNPNTRGTGIWIETNATVRNSTLRNNNRDGIAIVGSAKPTIANNRFLDNTGNGIFISNEASGEIRNNEFRNTGYGMAIDGKAYPLVQENYIVNNRSGIIITKSAHPTLDRNRIENNEEYSIIAVDRAQPVLKDNTLIGNGNDRIVMGIPQGNPPQPPVVTAKAPTTQFGCMQSGDDLAITVRQGKKTLPKIMSLWTREVHQGASANLCQTVTERLNDIVADNGNSFNGLRLMSGQNEERSVVCLVNESQTNCNNNNIIFQPATEDNAKIVQDALQEVVANLEQTRRYPYEEENIPYRDSPGNRTFTLDIDYQNDQIYYINLQSLDEVWESDPGLWFLEQ
ncbi:MAG: right-handed parallel beta-helix repeat-containing protein [Hormoscilla sp.]